VTSVVDGHRLFGVLSVQHRRPSVSGTSEGSALVTRRPAVARAVQKWLKCGAGNTALPWRHRDGLAVTVGRTGSRTLQ